LNFAVAVAFGCFVGFGFLANGLSGHVAALPPLSDLHMLHIPPVWHTVFDIIYTTKIFLRKTVLTK
jgi:hypothetical protein